MRTVHPRLCTAALAVVVLAGCTQENPTPEAAPGGPGIERTFERGPVAVTVRIDKKKATIADRIHLEIEVAADADYAVTLPSFGENLDQFGIVDYTTAQPQLADGGRVVESRHYVLEPFLSGEYTVPPMQVSFTRKGAPEDGQSGGDSGDGGGHVIETEAFTIEVTSLLPADAEKLEINEIAGPVEIPAPDRPWTLWSALAAAVTATGLAAAWWIWRRRAAGASATPEIRPAHEIAFAELERLVGENLPERGLTKPFYQRISETLRRYIENRFGLHAPDQTTEEFLRTLGTTGSLEASHKPLLKRFLQYCDLVKFAEHQPSDDDTQEIFDSCKNFILETMERGDTGSAREKSGAVLADA